MQPDRSALSTQHPDVDAVFQAIKSQVGQQNFDHWFHNKTTGSISGDELLIGVGSPFLLSWMQKRFRKPVLTAAQELLGPSARIRFDVDSNVVPKCESISQAQPAPAPSKSTRDDTRVSGTRRANTRRFADLSDYVEGKCNALALTAARQVCESPGSKFNPLFLHGGVGVGKTHLLEGVYRAVRKQFPALRVMFLTSEAFTNYFTQALREHTMPAFRQRFRNVDVLLVDDVDFLDSKRVIQEEFLHTFIQLESHGRQIILAADRHPRLLLKHSEELVTRFLSGMVCRIESPDFDTRRRIVKLRAKRMDAEFTTEALNYVAGRFTNNVRELNGALNSLETYFHMTGNRVGLAEARKVLVELERDCVRLVRMSDVEQAVCDFFGVKPDELKSSKRQRTLSRPRMLAMFLIRKHMRAAYSEIGQYFGGRNHTTVISAEKKVQSWLKEQTTIEVASQTWRLDEVVETLERQMQAS